MRRRSRILRPRRRRKSGSSLVRFVSKRAWTDYSYDIKDPRKTGEIIGYHVTSLEDARNMTKEGFKVSKRKQQGQYWEAKWKGMYFHSAPNHAIDIAEQTAEFSRSKMAVVKIRVPLKTVEERLAPDEDISPHKRDWLKGYKEGSFVILGDVPPQWFEKVLEVES